MKFKKVIKEDCITILQGNTKEEVLLELIELFYGSGKIRDVEALKKGIFQREKVMSTGIGLGIAVPHVRIEEVDTPIAAIGISKKDIQDYEALDKQGVRIVIMIVAGQGQHQLYLKILSQVVSKLKDDEFRKKLLESKKTNEIYTLFKEEV